MTRFMVTVEVEVTDEDALAVEAKRRATSEAGMLPTEFDHYRKEHPGGPVAFDLGWMFDQGSPLEAGIQIEDSTVEPYEVYIDKN